MIGADIVATWAFRLGLVAVILLLVFVGVDKVTDTITAPFKTQLAVSRANNAGMKAATDVQNTAVDGLQQASTARKARSREAVKAAGEPERKRAQEIHDAPAVGDTDYQRAANRIDRELGLQ